MNTALKKIGGIALKVVTWLLVAFTVFMMVFTVFTVSTVDKNDRGIFGMKFYIVRTDSMSPSENNKDMDVHFSAGDIVLIQSVNDPYSLEEGDVIAFLSQNSVSYNETVTHMIHEVKKDENGNVIGYATYGTNTGEVDEAIVEPEYVIGKYVGKLPGVGNFFAFVKSVPGYIVCILIPFLLLILYNTVNVIRLFRRYKREQTAIMEAEKAELEAERLQNEEERRKTEDMMRELLALKAQLEQQANPAPTSQEAETTAEVSEEASDAPSDEN